MKEDWQRTIEPWSRRIQEIDRRRDELKSRINERGRQIAQLRTALLGLCLRITYWEKVTGFAIAIGTALAFTNPVSLSAAALIALLSDAFNDILQKVALPPWYRQAAAQGKAWSDQIEYFLRDQATLKREFNELSRERRGLADKIREETLKANRELNRLHSQHLADYDWLIKRCQPPSVYGPRVIPPPDAHGDPPTVEEPDLGDPQQWFWERLNDPNSTDVYE